MGKRMFEFSEEELESLSLHKHSLEEILQNQTLRKLKASWSGTDAVPKECSDKCRQREELSAAQSRSVHERLEL